MDIKVDGLTYEIVEEALEKCRKGRLYILDEIIKPVIAEPRKELSPYAPKMFSMMIPVDKIKDVIGKGGKVIQEMCANFNCKIDIEEDGHVFISAVDQEDAKRAIATIKTIVEDPEIGAIYKGRVTRLMNLRCLRGDRAGQGRPGSHLQAGRSPCGPCGGLWLPWAIPSSSWSPTSISRDASTCPARMRWQPSPRSVQPSSSKQNTKGDRLPREPVSFLFVWQGRDELLVGQNFLGVAGNHQFLVGFHHQRADAGAPGGDFHHILVLAAHTAVFVGIDADAQPIHVMADLGAGLIVMLADAAGEDDGVHTTHSGDVAADDLLDLVVQHIQGQLCAFIAVLGGGLHVTDIAGNTGNAQQAGLLVQDSHPTDGR